MRDFDIRTILKDTKLHKFKTDSNAKIVDELELPAARGRIDVAVINGKLWGYEIKSASDNLKRIPAQLEAYTKIFDYLSVVTENKHFGGLQRELPEWVGIYICSQTKGKGAIKEIRPPQINTQKDSFFIANLLRKDELLSVLAELKIPHRKGDRNWLLCESLAHNADVETISDAVRSRLKIRRKLDEC